MIGELEIRPVAQADLKILDRTFKSEFEKTHADDLSAQIVGEISFMVAWLAERPIGHVLINWKGSRDKQVAALHPDCPELYRFNILDEFQSRGVGTGFVEHCEREARARGFAAIGLGVAHENVRAQSLYLRLDFKKSEPQTYLDRYQYRDANGAIVQVEDECLWMTKAL